MYYYGLIRELNSFKKSNSQNHSWYMESTVLGHLGGSVVEHLPLAQVVVPGSWDRVPHRAPCMEPASPSACVSASLSVS